MKSFKQDIVVDSVKSSRQVKQQKYNTVTIINFKQNVVVNASEDSFAAMEIAYRLIVEVHQVGKMI